MGYAPRKKQTHPDISITPLQFHLRKQQVKRKLQEEVVKKMNRKVNVDPEVEQDRSLYSKDQRISKLLQQVRLQSRPGAKNPSAL